MKTLIKTEDHTYQLLKSSLKKGDLAFDITKNIYGVVKSFHSKYFYKWVVLEYKDQIWDVMIENCYKLNIYLQKFNLN